MAFFDRVDLTLNHNILFEVIFRVNIHVVLLFGENSKVVAYLAQPLCWSG